MADFTAGQKVTVKAGMFRRPGGIMIPRHSTIELTEDDIKRSDLDLLVTAAPAPEPTTSALAPVSDEPITADNDGVGDTGLDLTSDLTVEQLTPVLSGMTVEEAKKFLANEAWTHDNMFTAREAEEQGKNRSSLLDYIDDRLLDLEDGEDGA